MRRGLCAIAAACSLVMALSEARGQSTAERERRAGALFEEAMALIAQDRAAEACPKLEESDRLDPAIGTMINLGGCYKRIAKKAWALLAYRTARARAEAANDDRRELARRQEDSLAGEVVTARLKVSEPEDGWLIALRVNGRIEVTWRVAGGTLAADDCAPGGDCRVVVNGDEALVDSGELTLTALPSGGGRKIFVRESASAGARVVLVLPRLGTKAEARASTPTESAGGGLGPQAVGAIAVGTLGAASLVVGIGTIAASQSKFHDSQSNCVDRPGPGCLSVEDANALISQSNTLKNAAIATFVLAGVSAAVAIPLGVTSRGSSSVAARVAPAPGGGQLVLSGAF